MKRFRRIEYKHEIDLTIVIRAGSRTANMLICHCCSEITVHVSAEQSSRLLRIQETEISKYKERGILHPALAADDSNSICINSLISLINEE